MIKLNKRFYGIVLSSIFFSALKLRILKRSPNEMKAANFQVQNAYVPAPSRAFCSEISMMPGKYLIYNIENALVNSKGVFINCCKRSKSKLLLGKGKKFCSYTLPIYNDYGLRSVQFLHPETLVKLDVPTPHTSS